MTKNNPDLGKKWRFGPTWPGKRCGAKTRKGSNCMRPAHKRNGRCGLHGGLSQGPTSKQGLERLAASKTKTGKFSKAKRELAKERAELGRQIRKELKQIEAWAISTKALPKNWKKQFPKI